jgi:hypothetical protein
MYAKRKFVQLIFVRHTSLQESPRMKNNDIYAISFRGKIEQKSSDYCGAELLCMCQNHQTWPSIVLLRMCQNHQTWPPIELLRMCQNHQTWPPIELLRMYKNY